MKKVLVALLVLAVALSSAFAVEFTGEFVGGYQFNYGRENDPKTPTAENEWNYHIMGQDGDDSNTTKLVLGFADENGIWDLQVRGFVTSNYRTNANLNINFDKLIWGSDTDIKLQLGFVANDNQAGLRAYHNGSGNNFDRVRTGGAGLFTKITAGYGNLFQIQVAGTPDTTAFTDGGPVTDKPNGFNDATADIIVSAKTQPLDGLAISAAYVYAGDDATDAGKAGNLSFAADVNVGALANLDFDLGVSAAYKLGLDAAAGEIANLLAAEVYFGFDLFNLDLEYSWQDFEGQDAKNYLYVGAGFDVTDAVAISAWFGSGNVTEFGDTWFLGAKVDYAFYQNMSFGLGVEYSEFGNSYEYDRSGLNIVPTFKVSF